MTRLDGHDRRIVLVAAVADNGVIGDGGDQDDPLAAWGAHTAMGALMPGCGS